MTIRRVAKDVQFLGRTVKANQAGFGALGRGRRAAMQGAAMTHFGGAASLAGGATLLGLGGAARSFAEFDKISTQAATQIGNINNSVMDVVDNADALRNAILDQMRVFPDTAETMSNAAYDIFSSMDVNFGRGIELLELFNETAVAGMTDVETATEGAITVLNNFGSPNGPIGKSRDLMNEMFSIIRFGRIDLETLNTMMNQIAPAAAAADQKLSDVGGAIATLTRRLGPSIASAGLARLFEIFQRRDFQEGMRKAGVAITDAQGQLLPLQDIVRRIVALGPKPGKSLQNFIQTITAFGAGKGQGIQATVQARRALVELVKHSKEYFSLQGRMTTNQNQFNKQLRAMQQSLGVRWEVFVNNMRRLVLLIGEDAIPTFERLGKMIAPLADAWSNLGSGTQAAIVATIGFMATFSLLGGLLLSTVGMLRSLYGVILMVSGVIMSRLIPSLIAWAQTMALPGGPAYALQSLAGSLRTIGALGAISIGLTLMFKGEGWESFLGAALSGAGAGLMVGGPLGAAVGAVTVPIIMKIVEDINKEDVDPEKLVGVTDKEIRDRIAELRENLSGFNAALPQSSDWWKDQMAQIDKLEAALQRRARKRSTRLPLGSIAEIAQEAKKIKIPRIGEDIQTEPVKSSLKGVGKVIREGMFDNVKTMEELDKAVQKQLTKSNKTIKDAMKERADILRESARDWSDLMRELGKDQAEAMEQATEEQKTAIESAASSLVNTWNEFRQANETAMGTLFQGPFLTSETFNLAEEWGITPAIQDLNRDLRQQLGEFNKWQQSLRAIGRRGAPRELLQSLEALGPDAVDKLEVLRKASPKMFNEFIRLWNQRQAAIKKETQIDFDDQLEQWNKYGKDIAFEIISGLRSEDVTLQKGFEKYVTTNFGGALSKVVDTAMLEFEERKREAIAEFKRQQERELEDFYREHPELRKAKTTAQQIKKVGAARRTEIKQGDKTNITVNQQPGEDGVVTAKRAAWEAANRKKAKKVPKSKKVAPGATPSVRGSD